MIVNMYARLSRRTAFEEGTEEAGGPVFVAFFAEEVARGATA